MRSQRILRRIWKTGTYLLLPWTLVLSSCALPPHAGPASPVPPSAADAELPVVVTKSRPAPPPADDPLIAPEPSTDPTGAIFYVSDCDAGADSDCVPGDDHNDGREPEAPWRTYEKARSEFSRLEPGDAIAFARGGVFTHAGSYRWNNAECRSETRCFIMDYNPPWGSGDESRPRIVGGSYGFDFSNSGGPRHHEGYVVRNLVLSNDGDKSRDRRWGIFFFNDIDDVLLEDLVIEGFSIAVHLASGKDEALSERIVLRDSRIVDNSSQGWLGGATGVRIENNHFENNGFGSTSQHAALRHHNLYLNESSEGVVIRGNSLHRSSMFDHDGNSGTPTLCYGTSLVVHGSHKELVIEDNTVYEDHAGRHCWGISVDGGRGYDAFEGLTIRRNRVVNVGAVSIGCTSCSDTSIENNVIVQHNVGFEAYGIQVPTKRRPKGDGPTSNVRVHHNSLYFDGDDAVAIALGEGGRGFSLVGNATAHAGSGRLICSELDLEGADYQQVDHNTCHHVDASKVTWAYYRGEDFDLAAWQARSGFDRHSAVQDPHFAAPKAPAHDLALTASSSLIDAATTPGCPAEDIDGAPRPQGQGCDIGAFEFAAPANPARRTDKR